MQLESLQIDIRPGSHAAAIDLGQSLLRRYWQQVYLAWWLPWLTLAVLLWLCLPAAYLGWGTLAIWWLRPLFDRLPVYILSREVFGERVTAWQALRAWPWQLGGWLRSLTWWRPIMLGRGLYAPIWMLEGAKGRFANQRRRALGARGAYGAASWFGLACVHFTLVLELALLAMLGLFMARPEEANPMLFMIKYFSDPATLALTGHICYVIADGLIGPVYASGCFTLYLRRRAELEGWDIELSLRRLAERRRRLATLGKSALAMLLCAALWALPQHDASAATCAPSKAQLELEKQRGPAHNASQAALRRDIDAVFQSDEFRQWDCQMTWAPKKRPEAKQDDEENWLVRFLTWLFKNRKPGEAKDEEQKIHDFSGAGAVKLGLIGVLVALFAWLLWRYRGPLGALVTQRRQRAAPPQQVLGMDIRPETLPEDVPASVNRLWQAGSRREALALLYRATVSKLAHDHALELHRGDTEGDILAASQAAHRNGALPQPAEAACAEVTGVWRNAAYAARWPDDAQLDHALAAWRLGLGGGGA
ncbi:DUF4129 domain-containing protein [Andreprevotia sp. IGB-42]|uniref:DUF4129 domain-containing protein n=1 Tax=Andreprevotia sp. IGB-42 TaxID=2497473 RepID=UPI00135BBFC8|nr:DUF4129 domain-containing protein [Andreprevotia sp. IGB-42]